MVPETTTGLGRIEAKLDNSGKATQLVVTGEFPTNGEKILFRFEKTVPQGINEKILLLTLIPGTLVVENGPVSTMPEPYPELVSPGQYESVEVRDEEGRLLAQTQVVSLDEQAALGSGNLGSLDTSIETEEGKLVLKVWGQFPTNGEKPRFHLRKRDPQGSNPTILLLELAFGGLVDPNGKGTTGRLFHREPLESRQQFLGVQVIDPDGRTLAYVDIFK